MKTIDFIVPLPLTLEEYQKGQVYLFSRAAMEDSTSSDSVEFLVNDIIELGEFYQVEPLTCAELSSLLDNKKLDLAADCGCDTYDKIDAVNTSKSSSRKKKDEKKMRKMNTHFYPEIELDNGTCHAAKTIRVSEKKEDAEEEQDDQEMANYNEDFQKEELPTNGRLTYKRYHLDRFLPAWVVTLLPHSATILNEVSLNFYPHTVTWYRNPWFSTRFFFSVSSFHSENVRDILKHYEENPKLPIQGMRYPIQKPSTYLGCKLLDVGDPTQLCGSSEDDSDGERGAGAVIGDLDPVETGIISGPRWWENYDGPIMIAVKRITVKFRLFGFQNKAEELGNHTSEQFILRYHRKLLAWASEWRDMSMSEIREFEDEAQKHLMEYYGESAYVNEAETESEDQPKMEKIGPVDVVRSTNDTQPTSGSVAPAV